ncbi:SI1L3 protein, partial [Spelaeornis formosus]|nr:SI1L3 protein [Elachura formosa]
MGVRARATEWPPRCRAPLASPSSSSSSRAALKPSQRPARRSRDAEFSAAAPLRQRSSSELTLSECDPEENPENRGNAGCAAALFREYGSTSSIDAQGIPEQSFYEILNEFRASKPQLAAKTDETPAASSKEKTRRRCLRSDESIFRKLRASRHDADADEAPPKSWICRKAFAHFDVQSILFEPIAVGVAAQMRNTTTGASAASAGSDAVASSSSSSTEDLNCKENLEQDLGDNTSNELLLSCPHFRNEIGGGGGERDVSFSRSGFAGFAGFAGVFRKVSNAGVAVLEAPAERRRERERGRGFGVEHADAG